MIIVSNLRFVSAIIAVGSLTIGFYPYFRDIFKRKTTPHLYTWLIWAFTQATATAASWYGGGKFNALTFAISTVLVIAVFCLSFKYGTKNITKGDTVLLILALLAIVVWWQMGSPLIAVIMVTVIDAIGYIPTFRKSYVEPWSETLSFWAIMVLANIFTIAASAQYNFLTVTYAAMLLIANGTVWVICFFRRRVIKGKGVG
jgi:hypothetical protein